MEQPVLMVVNIPAGLSADAVQQLVNDPLQDDAYYFAGVIPYGQGALAFFRISAAEKTRQKPDEDAALAFLKANPLLSCTKLRVSLAAKGINRTNQWVYTRRAELDEASK